jgi:hypothetical protein
MLQAALDDLARKTRMLADSAGDTALCNACNQIISPKHGDKLALLLNDCARALIEVQNQLKH